MATSEQLEREAEAARAGIAATLDELRGRMTAGQVVDQLADYARDNGAGDLVRNVGRRIVDNPIPVTLLGAGLAWLMMTGRAGEPGKVSGHDGASVGMRAADAGNSAGAAVREAASSAYDATPERARQATDAIARGTGSVRERAATGGAAVQNMVSFLHDQPLVVAGIGLALGALLGSSFASTDREDRLMGAASDAMKRDARNLAEEQIETGKAAAAQAWDAAKSEAGAQLRRDVQYSVAGSGSAESTAHQGDGEATLVSADDTGRVETPSDAIRRETEPASS